MNQIHDIVHLSVRIQKVVLFFICHLKHKRTQFYAERAMNKLKYKPTITSSIPNYISKADA